LQLTPERAVIALGGGALARPENEALLDLAHTVFLQAPVEELWRRCQEHSTERPLRRDLHQFRALYQSRQSAYSKAAMTVQTAGKTVEQVADEVTRRAGLKGSAKEK